MSEACQDHHNVEYLVATANDIKRLGGPLFWYLLKSQHSEHIDLPCDEGKHTLAA